MEDSEDIMTTEDAKNVDSPTVGRSKAKKRSLVERELETNLTAKITSPLNNQQTISTSRYGRARKLKITAEVTETKKNTPEVVKSTHNEKSPIKPQSPVYKMHASNSPIKIEAAKNLKETFASPTGNNQEINISNGSEDPSPENKTPKIFVRKDIMIATHSKEKLPKNVFSPKKTQKINDHLNNLLERTSANFKLTKSDYVDNSSVVKTLDFDTKRKKKENKDTKTNVISKKESNKDVVKEGNTEIVKESNKEIIKKTSKEIEKEVVKETISKEVVKEGINKEIVKESKTVPKDELIDLEAQCPYQVGDLAWARMGTYPFWPSIVTRDPLTGTFVKKKLFGRVERNVIHVTFFGDNGRRSWIVENMLRRFMGLAEFQMTKEQFTPEDKKKDPKLYASFSISEKKQPLWMTSVEEAEMLLREPKRLRIELLHEMLVRSRALKHLPKGHKSGKISRADSDVSLSESLYDTLFSEDDGKPDDVGSSSRKKSLDVSEVVTACLDNMAAKTGITKIQKQSHMDRWLQKAKSKTPEKTQVNALVNLVEKSDCSSVTSNEQIPNESVGKSYSLRKTKESQCLLGSRSEHDYSKFVSDDESTKEGIEKTKTYEYDSLDESGSGIGIISKVESLADENYDANEDIPCDFDENSEDDKYLGSIPESNDGIDNDIPSSDAMSYDECVQLGEDNSCNEKVNLEQTDDCKNNNLDDNKEGSSEKNIVNSEKNIESVSTEDVENISEDDKNIETVSAEEVENISEGDKNIETVCTEDAENISEVDKKLSNVNVDEAKIDNVNEAIIDNTEETIIDNVDKSVIGNVDKPIIDNVEEENECLNNLVDSSNIDDDNDDTMSDDASSIELAWSPITVPGNSDDEKDMLEDDVIGKDFEDKQTDTEDFKDELMKQHSSLNDEIIVDKNLSEDSTQIADTSKSKPSDAHESNIISRKSEKNYGVSIKEDIKLSEKSDLAVNEMSVTKDLDLYRNKKSETKIRTPRSLKLKERAAVNIDNIDIVNKTKEHNLDNDIVSSKQNNKVDNKRRPEETQCNGDETHELLNGDLEDFEEDKYKKKKTAKNKNKQETDLDLETASINSEDSETAIGKIKSKLRHKLTKSNLHDPEFLKYLEMKQDTVMDENPELNEQQIVEYLYKTWTYEKDNETIKSNDMDPPNFVKGLEDGVRKRPASRTRVVKDKNKNRRKYFASDDFEDIPNETPPAIEEKQDVNEDTNKITEEIAVNKTKDKAVDKIEESTEKELHNSEVTSSLSRLRLKINASSLTSPKFNEDIGDKKSAIEKTKEVDLETLSIDSESSDVPLIHRKLRQRNQKETKSPEVKKSDYETASIDSEDSDIILAKRKQKIKSDKKDKNYDDPEFMKYLELRQDALIDENPQLTEDEIKNYLYNTWIYEESTKNEFKKIDDIEQASLIKGLNDEVVPPKKNKKQIKVTKHHITDYFERREKPKRKSIKPYYNEEYSDDSGESFEANLNNNIDKNDDRSDSSSIKSPKYYTKLKAEYNDIDEFYEFQSYFDDLVRPKPNVFKGLIREKVCDICENGGRLVKCRGCNAMFHVDCVKKQAEITEQTGPSRGRKKKKKVGRKPKNFDDLDNSEDKSQDISEENISMEEIEVEPLVVDAELFEREMEIKMKELLDSNEEIHYDCYSNEDSVLWANSIAGRCEIVNVQLKRRDSNIEVDYSDFKCNNCQKYDTPICFVCRSAVTNNGISIRQRCHVAHCHKYFHLECLEHWPQTQLSSGEPSLKNKKVNQHSETLTCPRHVCHTCVSDDPRGCKTRFSGDKLARCVRCPATYHSFTKCIPAGTQILNASHIICPRHHDNRSGKVSCHVNTGWCFICALGGSLICCEYCPTSFHAECLNIDPPEGGYMCEDCETGRLPLYGEMVWVKLGHYRWWPGIILHPSEIPENIMAVKHSFGEFVVRFFGQYDHYWVNRGRVFPFQEGDSGRISSQKSKIDAAFTMAMEHAQRACEILKSAHENEEESSDIASSLLPPHYVKLKVNKPCGSLCGWKQDNPELSLTQCECGTNDEDPCGPYSQCLNRMLLTECGPTCKTGERCNNRAFEKRQYPKLTPYRTSQRGWGLKTLENIRAGQFVIEYVGELIDEEEFRRRMTRKHEIRDENFYFLTLDKERMIDAGPKGNLARFMNHCCEPNCETQKWTVLGDIRVGLFAINDIPANSEVTFNYNLESAGIEKKRCFCGAKRCSGYIGAKPKQDDSQLKKPKRPYKKRKVEESPSTKQINKPKRPLGRPPKPKELTEIEKDLLIIKSATNDVSSDDSKLSTEDKPKTVKRRRVSFTNEEVLLNGDSQSKKPRND